MKRLFIFTYPKLTVYLFAIVVAYFAFQTQVISNFVHGLDSLFYIAIFFGGLLYSAGFSTPLATGFFLALEPISPLNYALIGAVGALIADLGIFSFIRISFMDEFNRLEHRAFIKHFIGWFHRFPKGMKKWMTYLLSVIIIASPLPDEIAVAILAGFTKIHPYVFMAISYLGNFIGILVLLSL